jgi:hypothetical protein
MKNLFFALLLVLGVGLGFFLYYYWQNHDDLTEKTIFETKEIVSEALVASEDLSASAENVEGETIVSEESEEKLVPADTPQATLPEEMVDQEKNDSVLADPLVLPSEFKLKVLFATQAPTENWDMPYQEACEEASLIMAYYYFANKTLNRPIMNEEILKLVKWEENTFGYYKDTTLAETARIAEEYFNLEVEINYNVTVDHLKQQLVKGNLIILPFAGRMLENPYFSGEGPLFHMAVVKGYDSKNFIMNDPGLLRLGENFKYSYKNLIDSVHDWNGGDVNNGQKVMLIVKGLKK